LGARSGTLDVPAEMFEFGRPQKHEAVAKFLDLVFNALKTVTARSGLRYADGK
jgi:glycerol-3-phosphate O-acyltransferase/dihydroxyacetone phosphate acyltransferase